MRRTGHDEVVSYEGLISTVSEMPRVGNTPALSPIAPNSLSEPVGETGMRKVGLELALNVVPRC